MDTDDCSSSSNSSAENESLLNSHYTRHYHLPTSPNNDTINIDDSLASPGCVLCNNLINGITPQSEGILDSMTESNHESERIDTPLPSESEIPLTGAEMRDTFDDDFESQLLSNDSGPNEWDDIELLHDTDDSLEPEMN